MAPCGSPAPASAATSWPKCTDDSLFATPEEGIHGAIEFGNRLLTYVLSAAVGWAIVASRSVKPRRRRLSRLAWAQFWVVVLNAVLGGITVWMELNPWIVAVHFIAANLLLTAATLTWIRAGEGDGAPRPRVPGPVRKLGWVLVAASAVLIVAGTGVTGSGEHAGDSSDVPRMPFDYERVAQVHAALAWVVCLLAVALFLALRAVDAPDDIRARARDLLVVLALQGAIGYVQYFTGVPEVLCRRPHARLGPPVDRGAAPRPRHPRAPGGADGRGPRPGGRGRGACGRLSSPLRHLCAPAGA